MNAEFNRMTIVAASEVVAAFKSHSDMELLEIQWAIADSVTGSGKTGRAASWAKLAVERSHGFPMLQNSDAVMTESGTVTLARAIVETAIQAPAQHRTGDCWKKFIAGLRFDGFEAVGEQGQNKAFSFSNSTLTKKLRLVRMLPESVPELDFREAESEVIALLNQHGFSVAGGHLNQAMSAFQRGEWSSANGELRNFYESYLNEIANQLGCSLSDSKAKRDFLGNGVAPPFLLEEYNEWNINNQKPQYVQGLMSRMHPHGGHPGLSEEEDATFRLQISLITARLFLRRFNQRASLA